MLEVPNGLTWLFIAITIGVYLMLIFSFYFGATERVRKRTHFVALGMLGWLIFQSTLSLNRWYMDRKSMPPHLLFPIAVSTAIMLLLFFTPRGRRLIDGLNMYLLTWLHAIRIPVELSLWWLAIEKQLPWSMTFEGRNFDILIGISAPVVAYLGFKKQRISPKFLLWWNIIGLASVMQVVIIGIGALPSPMQAWDFRQPNYAVMHFPFSWLPSFIVPAVVLSHIIGIRRNLPGYSIQK
jgi:hypothetical protein